MATNAFPGPDELFINLIHQFQQSALIYLGALQNPQTGKSEVNLQLAKYFIDTLDMLKNKTSGNLNERETGLLDQVLSELHIQYVKLSDAKK